MLHHSFEVSLLGAENVQRATELTGELLFMATLHQLELV